MLDRRQLLAALGSLAVASARAQEKLRVVASFSILADFVREIGGDAVAVTPLVGPDQDAHAFEPSPAHARALASAEIVVVNGLGFEGWMTRLVRASGFKGRTIVATEGIKTFRRSGDAHAHGGHAHGKSDSDPHVWQDPLRARAMADNIARGLAAADPGRAPTYRRNVEAYGTKLAELDAWVREQIAGVPPARRKIVSSHDAFGYFEERYAVDFRAPRGVSSESEPSAADLARIIRAIQREQVKIVFLENISDPRLLEQVAREGGARIGGRLYSDALSGPAGPAPTYLALMRHNVTLLREAMLAE